MKPVVKWAGGKTQLLKYILDMLPNNYNAYYEPFIGGGALLLNLKPENSTIVDINPELINLYVQIRDNVNGVIEELETIDQEHENTEFQKEFFFSMREEFNKNLNTNTYKQAARFIYLNKHCFNGLYRVNSKGLFNVPFNNKKKGNSFEKENLTEVSEYLKGVTIINGDFEEIKNMPQENDFVFFDSPYAPLNPTSFTDYTKEGFSEDDHRRLAELYKELSNRGVHCMLTNHNTELINELYAGFNKRVVQVSRNINSDSSNRKGEEIIITNYEL